MNTSLKARYKGDSMEQAKLTKPDDMLSEEQMLARNYESQPTRIAVYLPEEMQEALAGEVEFLSDWNDIS